MPDYVVAALLQMERRLTRIEDRFNTVFEHLHLPDKENPHD